MQWREGGRETQRELGGGERERARRHRVGGGGGEREREREREIKTGINRNSTEVTARQSLKDAA